MITTEIKTEIVNHPELGKITKQFIYTYENGIEVSKEFYSIVE